VKRRSIARMSTKELVERRAAAEEAEWAETLRARREKAEKAAAEQRAAVAKEQAALDRLAASPRRGVKGALGVSEFIAVKVLEVKPAANGAAGKG
jgi:hypothetical protein